ncbi:MAG: hypothetical protein ABTQ28_07850 [Thauera sp.]
MNPPNDWLKRVSMHECADFCERLICNLLHMSINPSLDKALTTVRGDGPAELRKEAYLEVLRHLTYAIALLEQAHRVPAPAERRT